jgi:hypothetical protein
MKKPHRDFIEKHKINIAESKAPAGLKRAISKWDEAFTEYEKVTDESLKTQWLADLEEKSKGLLEDLEGHFPNGVEIVIPPKKTPDQTTPPAPKPVVTPATPPTPPSPVSKDDLSDEDKEQLAIIDKLFAKAVNGELKITEDELSNAGFKCWNVLGFFSGVFGPYNFKSRFGSETWTITKPKN